MNPSPTPKETERPADQKTSGPLINPGSVLLSHCLTAAVSSALEDLTSVFEMGTGVTPPAWPPGNLLPLTLTLSMTHCNLRAMGSPGRGG